MKLEGLHALVTGGAGFIGSHLVDGLIEQGCSVRVIDNFGTGNKDNLAQHAGHQKFELVQGSITEPEDVAGIFENIDLVFHLATLGVRHSLKHPFENHRVNSEGTLLLLQEARRRGVSKFVHCSSSEVYGTGKYAPMDEDHPTYPHTIYGASKLAGEAYARAFHESYGMNTLIIRPFNTYGPRSHFEGDAGEMIPKSIVRALNGVPILVFGDGSQTRDFTYVEDVAAGLIAAAACDEAPAGATFNMGSGFEISIKVLAEKILASVGNADATIESLESRPGDVLRLFADASKILQLTGWRPSVPFEAGLEKTVAWFRSRPEGVSTLLSQEQGINWQ